VFVREADRILVDEEVLMVTAPGSRFAPRSRSGLHGCGCKFAETQIAVSVSSAVKTG
jgi:hypothetical protein